MKILMVNKFYYIKGGSETYYFALKKLLESKGHTVIDFSMNDEKNFKSKYSKYFVKNIDYSKKTNIVKKISMALKIIYSFEAKKKFKKIIKEERPDLIHLHIFQHQISPSILDVIKKYKIPTVYTAHDLKMVCLNYKMLNNGKICEECKRNKYYKCFKNKCVKNSYFKSLINVVEGYFHRWRKSYNVINAIITPSLFYKNKFVEFGIDSNKIYHIPNFLEEKEIMITNQTEKNYYLYFGRLSEEKGIFTLIKAIKDTKIYLKIVGTGPLENKIKEYIKNNKITNIELLGFKSDKELYNIVGNSKVVILPSEWYENGPYSAIESLKLGRPLIGANIGGIPELIEGNGFLFESGNINDLKDKIIKLDSLSQSEYKIMENKSFEIYMKNYTAQNHYKLLKKVYKKVIQSFKYN